MGACRCGTGAWTYVLEPPTCGQYRPNVAGWCRVCLHDVGCHGGAVVRQYRPRVAWVAADPVAPVYHGPRILAWPTIWPPIRVGHGR